jgi:prephenate dehydrogenase
MEDPVDRFPLTRATIVGVGLIGGSLGMALRARGLAREVVGVTRVPETIAAARERGAIDRGTVDPVEGVAGADLVVLATPPGLVVPVARQVLPRLRPGALVTDVASVKAEIVRDVEALLPPGGGPAFLGGHPMAGNEGRGIAAASAALFEGTAYLLTPTRRTPPEALARIAALARGLGASPVVMGPDEHDRAVAVTSHLPYLVAAALVGISGGAAPAAGPAFLGATRVAGSPVELWAQICRLNQTPIRGALAAFRDELGRLEAALGDGDRLGAMLERARRARASILSREDG